MRAIRKLVIFCGALAVLVFLAGGIVSEALHAARLRTVATVLDVKLPVSPADAKPGDIVLVTGTMTGDSLDLGSGNPSFPNAFMVTRLLERDRGVIRQRWRTVEWQRWISPNGRLGGWTVTRGIMDQVLDGWRHAVPQREFQVPRRIQGVAVQAINIKPGADVLEFSAAGKRYRLDYQVWSGNRPYTVLAQVADASGRLVPFLVPGLAGSPFSAMASGAHSDPSFLFELGRRDNYRNIGFLLLAMLAAAVAWFVVLHWSRDEGFFRTIPLALWRGVASAVPIALVAFWPATSISFIWITCASLGGAAGVLFLLAGLLFVETTG